MSLVIQSLSKTFRDATGKRKILDDFSIETREGEIVCVLGPSGCGKSTLLRIIAGLVSPDPDPKTRLLSGGRAIDRPGPDRGLVLQDYQSFPWLTAAENVAFNLHFQGLSWDATARRVRVQELLKLVGLSGFEARYPRQLSGGQLQRVAIARALAPRPTLLLMDEPYASLDAQTRARMQTELLTLWRRERPTVLFVTHDIEEAVVLAERILVFDQPPGGLRAVVDVVDRLGADLAPCRRALDHFGFRRRPAVASLVAELRSHLVAKGRC